MKKILVMGLPGSGKTTLSLELAKTLNAVHFNADEIRQKINKDLGFDVTDRVEHATRMGILCDIVNRTGVYAIADFVCPTASAREAFGANNSFVIWANRIPCRDFSDTTKLFTPPKEYHVRVTDEYDLKYWVNRCASFIESIEKKDFEI
jgi:hypothetical protein